MAYTLTPIETEESLRSQLSLIRDQDELSADAHEAIAITSIGSSVLNFAEIVFAGVDRQRIYAEHYDREPEGRGAHFDVYGQVLDENYPWLGVYNLAGRLSLKAVKLPDDLAASYFNSFPEPDDAAFSARRDYARIAMTMPGAHLLEGSLDEKMGIVIAQRPQGPHMIHDIVPQDERYPGEFIKLVCPAKNKHGAKMIENTEAVPLDELITNSLVVNPVEPKDLVATVPHPATVRRPGRILRPRPHRVLPDFSDQPQTRRTQKRPCHYD